MKISDFYIKFNDLFSFCVQVLEKLFIIIDLLILDLSTMSMYQMTSDQKTPIHFYKKCIFNVGIFLV